MTGSTRFTRFAFLFALCLAATPSFGAEARDEAKAPRAQGVIALTADLTDTLIVDGPDAGLASANDRIRYVVKLRNPDAAPIAGIQFTDTIDPHTTLVNGSLAVSPVAVPERYVSVGNTLLEVGVTAGAAPAVRLAGSLFDNDLEFLGDTFFLSAFDATSAEGGTVSVNANGTFTYLPAPGFLGEDSFTYTIEDATGLTSTARVAIDVAIRVWYLNSAAAAGGDGRSTAPFNTLTSVSNASDPDGPDDLIFLHTGTGTYPGTLNLEQNQKLFGEGVELVVDPGTGSITLVEAGVRPRIAAGAGTAIALASGNAVIGLDVSNSNGVGIAGAAAGALTLDELRVTTANGAALSIANGTVSIDVDSVAMTGASGPGVFLQANSGTTRIRGVTIGVGSGAGLSASSAGTLAITGAGNEITTGSGPALSLVSTTIHSNGLTFRKISSGGGTNGIQLSQTGSLGGLTVTGTGPALSGGIISGTTAGVSLTNVHSVSLADMRFNNNGRHISANVVTNGLQLTDVEMFDASTFGVDVDNLRGVSTFTNTSIVRSDSTNVSIDNFTGSASVDVLNLSNCAIGHTIASGGLSAVRFRGFNNANQRLVVTGGTYWGSAIDAFEIVGNQTSTVDVRVSGASLRANQGSAVNAAATGTAHVIADVRSMTDLRSGLNVINFIGFDTSVIDAVVSGVEIDSSAAGSGIRAIQEGGGTVRGRFENSTIVNINQANGIVAQARGGSGLLALTITGNTINNPAALALDGIDVVSGSSAGGDANTVCLNLANNSSSAGGGQAGYQLRVRGTTTFNLQNFAGNGASATDVATWINTTKGNAGTTNVLFTAPGVYSTAPANCAVPPALPSAPGLAGTDAASAPVPGSAPETVRDRVLARRALDPASPFLMPKSLGVGASAPIGTPRELPRAAEGFVATMPVLDAPSAPAPGGIVDPTSGETVSVTIGTLPGDVFVVIRFDVDVDPLPPGLGFILNQGAVASTGFPSVLTDDPDTGASGDPTATPADAPPLIAIGDVTATEGDAGTVSLEFPVSLSRAWKDTVKVDFQTAEGTATHANHDFVAASGLLAIPPGSTSDTVRVTANGDVITESDETFEVRLANPIEGGFGDDAGQGTIANDDNLPMISINDVFASEGDAGTTTFKFRVELTHPTDQDVTFQYKTIDNTATAADDDYEPVLGGIGTILAKTSSVMIDILVNGDTATEGEETFLVDLDSPSGAIPGAMQATGYIQEDDALPRISIGDVIRDEGDAGTTLFEFPVDFDIPCEDTVKVSFATEDGTALVSNSDYVPLTGQLVVPPGGSGGTITIAVNGDLVLESNETFEVDLSSPVGATIDDGSATGTIRNDDGLPQITMATTNVAAPEGNAGTSTLDFTVSLSHPTDQPVVFQWSTGDLSAEAGSDYVAVTLRPDTIPAKASTKVVSVTVNGDLDVEPDEEFQATINSATGVILAGNSAALGRILDDDGGPKLAIDDVSRSEGDAGTTAFSFTVDLSEIVADTVKVAYTTEDGSATTANSDYVAASGVLAIPPGDTTGTILVLVNGDATLEGDEGFTVKLSNPVGAVVTDGAGAGTIQNDDGRPTLSISNVSEPEGDAGTRTFSFTLSLSHPTEQDVTFDVGTIDGSATTSDNDYVAKVLVGQRIPAKALTYTFDVVVNGDATPEADESFTVGVDLLQGADLGSPDGTGTIEDDDTLPELTIHDVSRLEGNSGTQTFQFGVSLSYTVPNEVRVSWTTQDQSATTANHDYVAASGTLVIPANSDTGTISVTVRGDVVFEGWEVFRVELSNPIGATIADGVAEGVIENDEGLPSLSISDASVVEGGGGQVLLQFTVALSHPAAQPISFDVRTLDSTATAADNDYEPMIGGSGIAAKELATIIQVRVNGDTSIEPDEQVRVVISAPTNGATIADHEGVGTIVNDDAPPCTPLALANPSFELSSPLGWKSVNSATLSRVSTNPHSGAWSLRVRGPSSTSSFGINDSPALVKNLIAGARYTFSAWVRTDASLGSVRFRVREYDDDDDRVQQVYSTPVALTSSWQKIELEVTARGGSGSEFDWQIENLPRAKSETFYVDSYGVCRGAAADRPPMVTAPVAITAFAGFPISVPVSAADPDGDAIAALTADRSAFPSGNLPGFTTNGSNTQGTLTWTPTTADIRTTPYVAAFQAANALSSAVVQTAITVVPAPANLCSNSTFESGTSGWIPYRALALTRVTGGRTGTYALEVRSPSDEDDSFGIDDSPNCVAAAAGVGAIYRLTAWVRSATSDGEVRFRIYEMRGSSQIGSTGYSPEVELASAWRKVTVDYVVRNPNVALSIRLTNSPDDDGERFLVDDLTVELLSPPPPTAEEVDRLLALPVEPGDESDLDATAGAPLVFAASTSPNPMHDAGVLAFALTRPGPVTVSLFDAAGRRVAVLAEAATMPAGRHQVCVLGCAGAARPRAGLYFYRIEAAEGVLKGRVVVRP